MLNGSKVIRSLVIGGSLCFCFVISASAQNPAPQSDASAKLAKETKKMKEKIIKIGTGNDVTIDRRDGKSFHGSIVKIDTETVIVSDVDVKANVEINYQQIKRVFDGYGPAGVFTGTRRPPSRQLIWGIVAGAGILVTLLVLVVAVSKD